VKCVSFVQQGFPQLPADSMISLVPAITHITCGDGLFSGNCGKNPKSYAPDICLRQNIAVPLNEYALLQFIQRMYSFSIMAQPIDFRNCRM